MKKLEMTITFDKELRLRHSKNESCSKWHNELRGQSKGDSKQKKFPNSIVYYFIFYFFSIFNNFFFYFTYLYLSKNSEIFLWCL